jgi:hypothetical protein
MNKTLTTAMLSMATVLGAGSVANAEDASMGADLKVTIALQGKPCDEIASSKRNADSDYTATCKDGNRYRVFVNPQGRVVVEKQ